jgi:TonB family protein
MSAVRLPEPPAAIQPPTPVPTLLVVLDPWLRVFFRNLRDLAFPRELPQLQLQSAPAPFWPDVFVTRSLPWRRFLQSGGYHIVALALVLVLSRFIAMQPKLPPRAAFDHNQVIYYQPSEYLPPLDTRSTRASRPRKADPAFSRQPIISVPREPDNRAQTIVAPPSVKLQHDVPLPNIVKWADHSTLPIRPSPVVQAASISRIAPAIDGQVVAPPPDARIAHRRDLPAMQPSVVAPPPSVDNANRRTLGDLNVARSAVIAPAPQLPLGEQRAVPGGTSSRNAGLAPQVVPPPPSLSVGSSGGAQRVIALSLHPTVGAPPDPPTGNRRGSFAATPEGHAGASGDPGNAKGSGNENGSGSKNSGSSEVPAGLYVGPASAKTSPVAGDPGPKASTNSVNPKLLASVPPPRVTATPARILQPDSASKLSPAEHEVFGNRKFYSLSLNMPNLNSAGGSWIIRFAELNHDSPRPGAATADAAHLSAPAATRKVDPAYPLQLMRENVGGTVILYAVIHADGSVGNVRILRSVDDRLDQYASRAISQWHFNPATKDGAPVDVEATFQIPFKPVRTKSDF